ncbi:MAG: hypothetical protein A2X94_08395 [Bdellovibrionales bacterium GWB1_55_8]|nr:MAG: hypothetical protein A2X94_08395 [Bdellovibrionales bacterium GWB1_55_8]
MTSGNCFTENRVFCPLPWLHLAMTSRESEYRTCCASERELLSNGRRLTFQNATPEEVLISPALEEIREKMRNGLRVDGCSLCDAEERAGLGSMRSIYLQHYHREVSAIKEQPLRPLGIRNVELRLGNLCNLKCVMCSQENSSRFENKTATSLPDPDVLKKLEVTLQTVDLVIFRGGEPLINPNHPLILQELIRGKRAQDVALVYNTNGTHLPEDLRQLWQNFKSVTVWVSVDGIGEVNEFIRFPSSWKQVRANLATLDLWAGEILPLTWGITPTLQAYNALEIPRIAALLQEFSHPVRFPFLNLLHLPEALHVANLPLHIRRMAAENLRIWLMENAESMFNHATTITRKMNGLKATARQTRENIKRAESVIAYLDAIEARADGLSKLQNLTRRIVEERQIGLPPFIERLGIMHASTP